MEGINALQVPAIPSGIQGVGVKLTGIAVITPKSPPISPQQKLFVVQLKQCPNFPGRKSTLIEAMQAPRFEIKSKETMTQRGYPNALPPIDQDLRDTQALGSTLVVLLKVKLLIATCMGVKGIKAATIGAQQKSRIVVFTDGGYGDFFNNVPIDIDQIGGRKLIQSPMKKT